MIQEDLQNEKKIGISLRKQLDECVNELQELRVLENQLLQSVTVNEKSVSLINLNLS